MIRAGSCTVSMLDKRWLAFFVIFSKLKNISLDALKTKHKTKETFA